MNYQEIEITKISSNPNNPRHIFEGPKFDDLVNSIREKGVLEPVLVRQLEGPNVEYEIVAGERRFRALQRIAGEYSETLRIPAIIRDLNEDEAFEIMTIENLQREDLTPLEEAQSFESYVKRHKKTGLETLAEKTGIRPAYIRRRIALLQLPERALEAWDKGDLATGHLEELIRLRDGKRLKEVLDQLLSSGWRDMTVRDLRELISRDIPLLGHGRFDKKECQICAQNSEIQKKLWDINSMKKTHCLEPACFKQKQEEFLKAHWPELEWAKKFKTTGFVFYGEIDWSKWERIYTPHEKCLEGCEHFVTVLHSEGKVHEERTCLKPECLRRLNASKKAKETCGKQPERVVWHGQHFRDEFFKVRIPQKLNEDPVDGNFSLQAVLYSMLMVDTEMKEFFLRTQGMIKENQSFWTVEHKKILEKILSMESLSLQAEIKRLAIRVLQRWAVSSEDRRRFAEHLGIDLAKEWVPPDEYFQKKTIAELLKYGKSCGILTDKKAEEFLRDKLKKKSFEALKKNELIRVFKESGIDLVGKVPKEILKK